MNNALTGEIHPIGGHSKPEWHIKGDNESIFTSWTADINIARKFAGSKGKGGIIVTKTIDVNAPVVQEVRLVAPELDLFYQEEEYLISGIVLDVKIIEPLE